MIGKVGGCHHDCGGEVTVASVDTISRPHHLATLRHIGYGLVVGDACFPAGTLIDGRPIERMRPGDLVTAFCEHTQTCTSKRIIRTFRRPVGSGLLKVSAGEDLVVCPPTHPFSTVSGWKPAGRLRVGEEILSAKKSGLIVRTATRNVA